MYIQVHIYIIILALCTEGHRINTPCIHEDYTNLRFLNNIVTKKELGLHGKEIKAGSRETGEPGISSYADN